MAKLILTLDGAVVREYPIDKESLSIGRKHDNDIQLNDLTVSGRHALITLSEEHIYAEDLGSTNGTLHNGSRITKSLLRHSDVIQIGNYQFTYFSEDEALYEPTMFVKAEIDDTQLMDPASPLSSMELKGEPLAGVKILNGPLANKVLELRKPFNSVGFNGTKLAIIERSVEGYTISGLTGSKSRRFSDVPLLNGKSIGSKQKKLNDHDIIELVGTQMKFFYFR